jgi:hypothetical protein
MELITYLFVVCVAIIAIGLLVIRFQEIFYDVGAWLGYVKHYAVDAAQSVADYVEQRADMPTSAPRPDPVNEVASSASAKPAALFADDNRAFAKIDIINALATIKMIDNDGTEKHLSADKLAALVNMRAETVREMVRTLRGIDQPAETYDPAKHLSLDGGKRWIAR